MNTMIVTVAIADDHILYREVICNVINKQPPYQVNLEANSGKELLQKLSTSRSPAIILLDINMPVMDGFETMSHLKKKLPRVKVLALSGYSNSLSVLQMRRAGVHGYLSKTATAQEVIKALEQVHHNGHYFPDLRQSHHLSDSSPARVDLLQNLSAKEISFLKYVCTDMSYTDIAATMNVSRYTINDYRNGLFKKLAVKTRSGLVLLALKYKIIEPDEYVPEQNHEDN